MPGVLLEVSKALFIENPEKLVDEIINWVIDEFEKFIAAYATEATSANINFTLNGFDGKAKNKEQLTEKYELLKNTLDIGTLYNEHLSYATSLVEAKQYVEILKIFNHKALVNQVGKFFSLKPSVYTSKVRDIIKYGNTNILDEISSYLPHFE